MPIRNRDARIRQLPSAKWFILTIPAREWNPPTGLRAEWQWIRGQKEIGEGGYEHWQVCVLMRKKSRVPAVKATFTNGTHVEPTISAGAREYVWKEDTRVAGTQFEFGTQPVRSEVKADWDVVWNLAKQGTIDDERIPAGIRVRCYSTLRAIASDHARPLPMVREVKVFWGASGAGKTRRAWQEAGLGAYVKSPLDKWWDGYRGEENVIWDEFRGIVNISHLFTWLDDYPVRFPIKGSSIPSKVKRIWITSNLSPDEWYPDLTGDSKVALLRRLNEVVHFDVPYVPPPAVELVEAINHVVN